MIKIRTGSAILPIVLLLGTAVVMAAAGPGLSPRQTKNVERLEGKVTAVYDGDTIKVKPVSGVERRVRFIGVDTPEMDDSRETVRFMAFMAKRFTYLRLFGRSVSLTFDRQKEDVYGRLLAYVGTDSGGTTFNETLASEGFAYGYFKYPFDETMRKRIKAAESSARAAGNGLWREGPFPEIGPDRVREHLGRIVSVTFRCEQCFERGRYRIIAAENGGFEAVIPREVAVSLPGNLDYQGQELRISGLVELYKGRPQIMIGVPSQIVVVDRPTDRAQAKRSLP